MRTLSGLAVVCGLLRVSAPAASAAEKTGFVEKTFKAADGKKVEYVVFIPHNYDGKKRFPVILFLHGAGEKNPSGDGLGHAIRKHEKSFGFITVFPPAEEHGKGEVGGWRAHNLNGQRALGMLDDVLKHYKTDPRRVYLTGLSMGGIGTWRLADAFPDRWAAIVPVCGAGHVASAEKLKGIPTWMFHGGDDPTVPVKHSRDMFEALKKAGGNPKYTEYPGVGHRCWDRAYAEKELWVWLKKQKKE